MTSSMLKAKIAKALEKIGTTNGTAPRESQDPLDAVLHEYNVSSTIRGIGEKRYETAKKALVAALTPAQIEKLDKAINTVAKVQVSENIGLANAANHTLNAAVNNGATYLDTAKLRVKLLKTMPTDQVDKLFEDCMDRRAPTVTYKVTEEDDDG